MLVHKGTSLISLSPIKHDIQNKFILAEKLVPILRGIDMHYNTGRLEPSLRLETGNYLFSLFAVSFLCYNCQNYLVLIILFFFFFRNLTGKVTALFKYEDKSDINNCRPITVLPKVSKILERVLHQHLYGYMTEPNLLTAKQFSYVLNYKPRSYLLILRTEFWRNLIMNEYRGSISRSYKGF